LKIEIWSDYICPYCYKAKRVLEEALAMFGSKEEVEIIYRSYILSPDASKETHQLVNEMLKDKYGLSTDEILEENRSLIEKAKRLGLDYSKINELYDINTFDAHRIAIYAKSMNLDFQWTESLMNAHFVKGLMIDDHDVLLSLAKQIGLDDMRVHSILLNNEFANEVKYDMEEANTIGVETVPFFAINRTYAISGVITSQELLEALKTAFEQK